MRNSTFTLVMGVALLVGSAAHAVDATQKCQQSKLKAQGKLQSCLAKNAAGVIGGKADGSADCQTKFTTALQKADDKATAASTSCRYMDNDDGTVSDLNTGLVWEQKTNLDTTINAANPHDGGSYYTWSTGAPYGPTGTVYSDFLYKLNGGTLPDGVSTTPSTCFTGHCDWRLPKIEELQGILLSAYRCATSPCIDTAFGATPSFFYGSATTPVDNPDSAWLVSFDDGEVDTGGKDTSYNVRAVRCGL